MAAVKISAVLLLALCVSGALAGRVLTAAPGQLYIKITSSDTVTQVGQQPKIVMQFGNIGGTEITNAETNCVYDSNAAVRYVDRIQYFQKLIPGQNQNAEYQYRALEVGESTRYCYIQGYTLVNGVNTFVYAESNRITVKVVPQQG